MIKAGSISLVIVADCFSYPFCGGVEMSADGAACWLLYNKVNNNYTVCEVVVSGKSRSQWRLRKTIELSSFQRSLCEENNSFV